MLPDTDLQSLLTFIKQWCHDNVKVSSLAEAEQIAQSLARQIAMTIAQAAVDGLDDGRGREGCSIPCPCGRRAEFKGMRHRWVVSLAGQVRVERAYYYCRHCHTGVSPWDRQQGLDQRQWSASLKAIVCELAARLTFTEAVTLLQRTTGLAIQESSAEQIVQDVGGRLREQQGQAQAEIMAGAVVPAVTPAPARLYVSMDAAKAHIDGQWHDVKAGVIYQAKPGPDGIDRCVKQTYTAAQRPAEAFGEQLYAHAVTAGLRQAQETIVIGDGADWIWNIADWHHPQATQIVDYWHACQHIHGLAAVYYEGDDAQAKRWARDHCKGLRERGPAPLLRALRRMKPATEAKREAIRIETGYFRRHRQRMMYPQFRARGLMIGSGPVEAACKSVVGTRLKRSGMRWSETGADAVLAIRCAALSHDYEAIANAAKLAA
jgi:hypothetical protein